jgi:hypothetical protein
LIAYSATLGEGNDTLQSMEKTANRRTKIFLATTQIKV